MDSNEPLTWGICHKAPKLETDFRRTNFLLASAPVLNGLALCVRRAQLWERPGCAATGRRRRRKPQVPWRCTALSHRRGPERRPIAHKSTESAPPSPARDAPRHGGISRKPALRPRGCQSGVSWVRRVLGEAGTHGVWIWIWWPILRLTGRPGGARWRPQLLCISVGHWDPRERGTHTVDREEHDKGAAPPPPRPPPSPSPRCMTKLGWPSVTLADEPGPCPVREHDETRAERQQRNGLKEAAFRNT